MDELSAVQELVPPAETSTQKKKRRMKEEVEASQITINKSLPIPKAKKPTAERQSYFQVAYCAICTCGEVMARPREILNSDWSCMRILTGNKPTKDCQIVPAKKIRADAPPPRSDVDEVDEADDE